METRRLPALTRQLINACGGLEEAACACRISKSRLSECQTPLAGAFLPIDVVASLEAYCGEPIISRALVEARPSAASAAGLVTDAIECAEEASALQRLVRRRAGGKPMSQRERDELVAAAELIEGHLAAVRADLEGAQ